MITTAKDPDVLARLAQARRAREEHELAFVREVSSAARDRGGHTIEELARAAGITRRRVYQIAAGRR